MKIISIKKGRGNKYIIHGDRDITLYDDIIIKNNILFKKELKEEEIEGYLKENYKYEILDKIIKFIKRRLRSCYEIDNEIEKYELDNKDKDFIKDKLNKMGLYNDKLFLESYVHEKFTLSNDGPIKIKNDLLMHNIKEEDIDNILDSIQSEDIKNKLTKLVLKRIRLNHKYSKSEFIKRELINLSSLGYSKDMIYQIILDNYNLSDDDKLVKDYDKLYNKYKNKYDRNKLILTIKQKLYQKGYRVEDINQIIEQKKI